MNIKNYLLIILLLSQFIYARVIGPSLNQLVQKATWIGKVEITRVEEKRFRKNVASANVKATYKGQNTTSFQFCSSPKWTCDILKSNPNEHCIIFICKDNGENRILWSGRGKFLISNIGDHEYFELLYDVVYPFEIISNCKSDTVIKSWGKYPIRKADVYLLRKCINNYIEKPGQHLWDSFIPPNMFEWDSFLEEHKDLTIDEIKTLFDGEINNATTTRILKFLIGVPQYMADEKDSELWGYRTRNNTLCFRIQSEKVIEEIVSPKNIKWEKIRLNSIVKDK